MTPGALGVPAGAPQEMASIEETSLVAWIERGNRFAWERSAECPCKPINDQTRQPNVLCGFCQGGGRLYFGSTGYVVDTVTFGELTDLQTAILARGGMGIRGRVQKVGMNQALYDQFGNWIRSMSLVTVRAENKLGVMDRLVDLDQTISWSEVFEVRGLAIPLRGRCVQMNLLRSIEPDRVYVQDVDFTVVAGVVAWKPGRKPAEGVRCVAHMLVHQSWLVVSHPHALREETVVTGSASVPGPITPVGQLVHLPIQAVIKNEFAESDVLGYSAGGPT